MLKTYNECGGFCLYDWVLDAESDGSLWFRCAVFFFPGMLIATVLNIAWLCGIRLR